MTLPAVPGCYGIVVKGETCYVGKSNNMAARLAEHKKAARRRKGNCPIVEKGLRKHADAEFVVICFQPQMERSLISQLRPRWNIAPGGEGGAGWPKGKPRGKRGPLSETHRTDISRTKTGKPSRVKGRSIRPHSQQHREALRQSALRYHAQRRNHQ